MLIMPICNTLAMNHHLREISSQVAADAHAVVILDGAPPRCASFESLDKLQALYDSGLYKQAVAIGDKYATQRIFGVEGVSP